MATDKEPGRRIVRNPIRLPKAPPISIELDQTLESIRADLHYVVENAFEPRVRTRATDAIKKLHKARKQLRTR
jgi:hypothetical protein